MERKFSKVKVIVHITFMEGNVIYFLSCCQSQLASRARFFGLLSYCSDVLIQLKVYLMKNRIVNSAEDNPATSVTALFPELLTEQIQKQLQYTEIT